MPAPLPPSAPVRRASALRTVAALRAHLVADPGDLYARARLNRALCALRAAPSTTQQARTRRQQARQARRPAPCADLGALTGALVLRLPMVAGPGEYPPEDVPAPEAPPEAPAVPPGGPAA